MSQEISNIFRKNNRVDNIDDILADIYDLILTKLNSKLKKEDFNLGNYTPISSIGKGAV